MSNKPAVIDIRPGWHFAFSGEKLIKAIADKVYRIEAEIVSLVNNIETKLPTDKTGIVGLMVAMHSDTPHGDVRFVQSLCERVVALEEERDTLSRSAIGFAHELVYILDLDDMKKLGIGG